MDLLLDLSEEWGVVFRGWFWYRAGSLEFCAARRTNTRLQTVTVARVQLGAVLQTE